MERYRQQPAKSITPALLSQQSIGFSLCSQQPQQKDENSLARNRSKYLIGRQKRVYPLNLSFAQSPLDMFPVGNASRAEEQSTKSPKTHRKTHRTTVSNSTCWHSTTDQGRLPTLRSRLLFPAKGSSPSRAYEDFVVGGNSYNAHITDRIYTPVIVQVSPRSKYRLHHQASKHRSLSAVKTIPAAKKVAISVSHRKQKPAPALPDGIHYDSPALTYAEKFARIKYLVDTTVV